MSIAIKSFGKTDEGREVHWITLTNSHGASASFISFGAHLTSLKVPDREGKLSDVTLGMDTLAEYVDVGKGQMGGSIGRYGNRIAGASFELNGKTYQLYANNGKATLHGGKYGFDKHLWDYQTATEPGRDRVTFSRLSPHMEEGFPGNLKVSVTYTWDDDDRLTMDYLATSDQDTIINLTNHAYFNLGDSSDVKDQTLQIAGDKVVVVTDDLIPTGELRPVDGTPFDLREPVLLREALARLDDPMFNAAKGYDIGYALPGTGLREVAWMYDKKSGRLMTVLTDQPGVQCYSGQGFDCQGRGGVRYGAYAGLALETQHHPDTVHHPHFGDTTLKAGDRYETTTIYAFSIKD